MIFEIALIKLDIQDNKFAGPFSTLLATSCDISLILIGRE